MNFTVIFGIFMALLAAFFAQFGLVIQKKRVNTLEARFARTGIKKTYAADPIWLTAIFMNVVLAVICNSVANAQIGIALAVPVFNGGIVFLVIGLVLICGEKLTKLNLFAVFLLIAGLILTGAGAAYPYGRDPEDSHLRIAPTYPSLEEVEKASLLLTVCVRLAVVEKLLSEAE